MPRLRTISLYLQALLYVAAGVNHLWHPASYLGVMPPYFSYPVFWVAFTGYCEIAGGAGLVIPATRRAAGVGIALMLVGYFTVHLHMLVHHADLFANIPVLLLWLRVFFQPVLIWWALKSGGVTGADAARSAVLRPAGFDRSQRL